MLTEGPFGSEWKGRDADHGKRLRNGRDLPPRIGGYQLSEFVVFRSGTSLLIYRSIIVIRCHMASKSSILPIRSISSSSKCKVRPSMSHVHGKGMIMLD